MKITSTTPAKVCMALLVINPFLSLLGGASLTPNSYGILAALLAANAGAALFAGLVFKEFSRCTTSTLRLIVVAAGVVSGLASAVFWMADEADHIWLPVVFISPVVVILLVLRWFVRKAEKEGPQYEVE